MMKNSRRTEDGGRRTEDGRWRTEDGGGRREDGGWKTEDGHLFFRNLINEESCEAIEAC